MNSRPFEPADLEQIIAVYRSAIHVLAAPFYTPAQLAAWANPNPDIAAWRQRLSEFHTIVSEREGKIAGFASFQMNGYLFLLFTHSDFARQGVATRLYGQVESALRAAGVAKVFTEASLAGRPFFDRHGFVVEKEEMAEVRGAQLLRYAMQKPLPLCPS